MKKLLIHGRCAVRHNMTVEKYPAQFILPSRQGRNVLPETGCGFLFYTHIPPLTGRREMWQPVFSTNILCLRHKGGAIFSSVATRFYLVAIIPTGSTCQDRRREAQPRTEGTFQIVAVRL
ncbi:MAG: hypothetical protein LBB73_06985 [Dysgonamonadaceae bacterium]|nr:hypothetical protein [Dysgonamonadaceae bacterium]